MRVLVLGILVGALAGCLDGQPDPHELVTCDGWTDSNGTPVPTSWRCELACQTMPMTDENACGPLSRTFDGQAGACMPNVDDVIHWVTCP